MHHANERLNYKYVLIHGGTLNYVLNSFFDQVMIIISVDTAVSIYASFWCFTNCNTKILAGSGHISLIHLSRQENP